MNLKHLSIACVVFAGCGHHQELTRSAAKELISQSKDFSPVSPVLELSSEEIQCGLKEGLWSKANPKPNSLESIFAFPLVVTNQGKTGFEKLSPSYSGHSAAKATIPNQYSRTVLAVTGMTDYTEPHEGWTGKEVQFTWKWNWDDFPAVTKSCLSPRSEETGAAVFRPYDDGWRVEMLDANPPLVGVQPVRPPRHQDNPLDRTTLQAPAP